MTPFKVVAVILNALIASLPYTCIYFARNQIL